MKRSKHNLSHYRLCDMNLGNLYPVGCMEVLPGDTFRHQTTALVRMATLATPVMHPVHVRVHHWYVPNRLLWSDWEDFITGKTETTVPQITWNWEATRQLPDYLGAPPHNGALNALPVRAYNKIWNEFYRDQDLDTERLEDDVSIARARWAKDYFTTARPQPQQGEGIQVEFSAGEIPIRGIGNNTAGSATNNDGLTVRESDGNTRVYTEGVSTHGTASIIVEVQGQGAANRVPQIFGDLGGATGGIDVNDMRRAFALQRFAEARNRYGSRYVDYLRFLGVRPSDGRLDRPEYLGGGKQTVSFSEVLATAEGAETQVGDLAGHGIAAVRSKTYRRFFEEHGYVISLMSVRPKAIYMKSLPRHFIRQVKEDYWQKEYEAMGDQLVTNREVYAGSANPTDEFGYVQRFRDYREVPSGVAGAFHNTLADWHFGRQFQGNPNLNSAFVECDPDLRPFASQNDPQMYCMIAHRVAARRLVSKRARF